jgi:hypothetical protein
LIRERLDVLSAQRPTCAAGRVHEREGVGNEPTRVDVGQPRLLHCLDWVRRIDPELGQQRMHGAVRLASQNA